MGLKRKWLVAPVVLGAVIGLGVGLSKVSADVNVSSGTNNWKDSTVVYGESVTDDQVATINKSLGLDSKANIFKQVATGDDMAKYLGINTHPTMLSSVLVKKLDKGKGVIVNIVTPDLITKVTKEQYANASITAGASDVEIDVVAPTSVTGESALTGVYKAFEANGTTIDETRSRVAQDEIATVTGITDANKGNSSFDTKSLDNAMVAIKQDLANYKKTNGRLAEDTDVRAIIKNALDANGLTGVVTDEQIDQLIAFAKSYQGTSAIDDKKTQQQLGELKDNFLKGFNDLKDKASDSGILEKAGSFFKGVWDGLLGLFHNDKSDDTTPSN